MDPHLLHLALTLHRPHLFLGPPTLVPQLLRRRRPPSRPCRQAVGAWRELDSQLGLGGSCDLHSVLFVFGGEEL
jgi:hypothetical protein